MSDYKFDPPFFRSSKIVSAFQAGAYQFVRDLLPENPIRESVPPPSPPPSPPPPPPSWKPTDRGGCILWLRSDLGITKDGADRVGTWADQSGSGHDFTQATDSQKFVWTTAELNGYPGLISDGIDDSMVCATLGLIQPFTLFIVYKPLLVAANHDAFFTSQAAGNPGIYIGPYAGDQTAFWNGQAWQAVNSAPIAFKIWDFIWNGADSYMYQNGVPILGPVNMFTNGIPVPLCLSSLDVFGNRATNISWIEVIAYNSSLLADDRLLVENYLNGRYNLWA